MTRGRTIAAADLFCGAGGSSTGLVRAATARGIRLDLLAVNHWPRAVETHSAAHPWARHVCASLDSIDPRDVVPGRLDLLIASPECIHHSIARGGRPVNRQSRATAWCVVRWAAALLPQEILVENVKEFRGWGPVNRKGKPYKRRKGETYGAWVNALRSLGYSVEARLLCAADYGDPTTRERLYVRATRGLGREVRWPEPTHAEPGGDSLFAAQPWRTAREIIDWNLAGRSIFGRKKPLAGTTLERIAEGLRRFGGAAAEPFLVMLTHGGRLRSVDVPLPTITGANRGEVGVVEPYLVHLRGTERSHVRGAAKSIDGPVPPLTAGGTHVGLCEPFMVSACHGEGLRRRTHSLDSPLPTQPTTNAFGVVQPFILPHRQFDGRQVDSIDDPLRTVTAHNGGDNALVEPFVTPYYGNSTPTPVGAPLPTVTARDRFGLVQPAGLDIRFRMLQPHELAAAMGFPKDYPFRGKKGEVVRQIGNAVAVGMAEALCGAALEAVA